MAGHVLPRGARAQGRLSPPQVAAPRLSSTRRRPGFRSIDATAKMGSGWACLKRAGRGVT
jgi:hypothetical protein